MQAISVEPFGEGWVVRSDQMTYGMVYRSGRHAEDSAKGLGERLAEAGQPVEIRIFVRGGALVGRFICPSKPIQVGVAA